MSIPGVATQRARLLLPNHVVYGVIAALLCLRSHDPFLAIRNCLNPLGFCTKQDSYKELQLSKNVAERFKASFMSPETSKRARPSFFLDIGKYQNLQASYILISVTERIDNLQAHQPTSGQPVRYLPRTQAELAHARGVQRQPPLRLGCARHPGRADQQRRRRRRPVTWPPLGTEANTRSPGRTALPVLEHHRGCEQPGSMNVDSPKPCGGQKVDLPVQSQPSAVEFESHQHVAALPGSFAGSSTPATSAKGAGGRATSTRHRLLY